jgi:hypothetical protein
VFVIALFERPRVDGDPRGAVAYAVIVECSSRGTSTRSRRGRSAVRRYGAVLLLLSVAMGLTATS